MRKKSLKLQLSRETLRNLVAPEDLDKIQGGIVSSDNRQCTYTKNPAYIPGGVVGVVGSPGIAG